MNQVMRLLLLLAVLSGLIVLSAMSYAGMVNPVSLDTISGMPALETKLGLLPGDDEILYAGIWNDGNENLIDAMRLDAGPDGVTVVQSENGIDGGQVFALGDWCFGSTHAVIPYVKDFDLHFLRYDYSSGIFASMEIPASQADQYTATDCFSLNGGGELVIAANNFDLKRLDYWGSADAGQSWNLQLSYSIAGDTIIDAFAGGFRDTHGAIDDQYIGSTYQRGNGMLESVALDWAGNVRGSISMGSHSAFVGNGFLKETDGKHIGNRACGIANGGTAIAVGLIDLPDAAFDFAIANAVETGTFFPFQGVSVSPADNQGSQECHFFSSSHARTILSADDMFSAGFPEIVPGYPFEGGGGPVDSVFSSIHGRVYVAGVRAGDFRGAGGAVTMVATIDPALAGGGGGGGEPVEIPVSGRHMTIVLATLLLLIGGLTLRSWRA